MKIAFFASNTVPFHARTLEERPLGGTETGVIRLTEALDALGHEVTVFTPLENPPHSKPKYLPQRAIESHPPVDVFISIRDWIPLFYPIQAKARMLWSEDSYDQYSNFGMGDRRVVDQITCLLTVSQWQANALCRESGFPIQKTFVLGNGIEPSYFEGVEQRQRKRLIYSSTPHRGLTYIPEYFTELRKKHPDAECHIFSSYKVYDQEGVKDFTALEKTLRETSGVVLHGSVRQRELAREFMKSAVLFYPTDFEETFCITAVEAQAAGCVVLSSRLAALPETVGDAGILIDGTPKDANYGREFLRVADQLLSDGKFYEEYSRRALVRSRKYAWKSVAEHFIDGLCKPVLGPL